jgi:cell pole-organizing protein PopZ
MVTMADSKPGQEPSMEEILSSIRRIIAEDESVEERSAPGAPARLGPASAEPNEVLELTEIVAEPGPRPTPPPAPPPSIAATRPVETAAPTPVEPARHERSVTPASVDEGLISAEAAKASAQALARLTRAGSADERKTPAGANVTMEKFLTDMLTPLLREWLDRHLPEIVERVVEQEVKKLARRAELL